MSKVKPIYMCIGRLSALDEQEQSILVNPYCEITDKAFTILEQQKDEKYYNLYEISIGELRGILAMMEALQAQNSENNGTFVRMTASKN